MIRHRLGTLLLCLTISLLSCQPVSGGLYSSVKKYLDQPVSAAELRRLKQYDHLIRYFCSFNYVVPDHKVNPDFVRALILAESGANPRAISEKDALGLGQIIYPTGKRAAKRLASSRTTFRYVAKNTLHDLQRDDLFDPAVNILLTCYLVATYNHKFDGRLDLVVSAWNAGEYTPSLRTGKHAPYEETEKLIGKINGYYLYLIKNRLFQ